jgi:hypothetical protein
VNRIKALLWTSTAEVDLAEGPLDLRSANKRDIVLPCNTPHQVQCELCSRCTRSHQHRCSCSRLSAGKHGRVGSIVLGMLDTCDMRLIARVRELSDHISNWRYKDLSDRRTSNAVRVAVPECASESAPALKPNLLRPASPSTTRLSKKSPCDDDAFEQSLRVKNPICPVNATGKVVAVYPF